MKNHTLAWNKWGRKDDGIHFDKHEMHQHMQNIYRIPSMYQEPNEWLKNHLTRPDHSIRSPSARHAWFIHDFQLPRGLTSDQPHRNSNCHQDPNRPSNKFNRLQPHQTTDSTWTPIQLNLADEAEAQRPLMINRTMPEPQDELLDTEE